MRVSHVSGDRNTLSHFGNVSAILLLFVNGSEILAVTGRDKDATWRTVGTLCRERDWSKRRLIYELENGLPYRTVPPGWRIDWSDDSVWPYFNIEASEISIGYGTVLGAIVPPTPKTFRALEGGVTLGIEVLPPTDAELPAAASVRWAIATTRRLWDEGKIPEGMTKANLARLLEAETQKDVKVGQLGRALKASYLENQLADWGIWPLSSFK
jgi:hypothetical protein